jgi:ribosome-associated heat shock protein Hsp15
MPRHDDPPPRVRIDKWLWAARFFKTRALAAEAVNGGKVHLGGQRIKAARAVHIGDLYEIQRGWERMTIVVKGLSGRRVSASLAQELYEETAESIERRQREAEQRRLARMQRPVTDHRPNKKERRQLRSFSGKA